MVPRTFAKKPRSESGLDCLICAEFARQRSVWAPSVPHPQSRSRGVPLLNANPTPSSLTPGPQPLNAALHTFKLRHLANDTLVRGGGWTGGAEKKFVMDNLLVRIHCIIEMIWWTGLSPREFEFPFPGSLTSTFLEREEPDWRERGTGHLHP